MDLAALRSHVREVQFGNLGVTAIVTPPGETPIPTLVVWLTPETPIVPTGEFGRSAIRELLAIRRDEVPSVPRGTTVSAAKPPGTVAGLWVVDATDSIFPDHTRVVVIPVVETP